MWGLVNLALTWFFFVELPPKDDRGVVEDEERAPLIAAADHASTTGEEGAPEPVRVDILPVAVSSTSEGEDEGSERERSLRTSREEETPAHRNNCWDIEDWSRANVFQTLAQPDMIFNCLWFGCLFYAFASFLDLCFKWNAQTATVQVGWFVHAHQCNG